ncbi:GDSL esterase/lipase 7-like [Chenopodium quinoa]|uniref:GDSL esterase/lipase 7-like n=1 Tax=Chenopodium quinoa TaxID=63459 RepID=UPI000B7777CC|nr:GDSL esterase/lipase 7-like [Chenopodium quinoa]
MLHPKILNLIILIFTRFLLTQSSPLVPALYVLGDSLVDSGNNNMLPTFARANYAPYSVNFPGKIPLGRFNNGRTVTDFIAEYLELPYPRPYASTTRTNWNGSSDTNLVKENSSKGRNYASAACGILPETGTFLGKCFPMDEQIGMFKRSIDYELAPVFKSPGELLQHLSKSIFFICAGNSDYLQNYFQTLFPSSKLYNPPKFAQLLVDKLSQQLKRLYELGARKVIVTEIGPLGCTPSVAKNPSRMINLQGNNNGMCDEGANNIVSSFNNQLPFMIENLTSTLPESLFTIAAVNTFSYDVIMDPSIYGFSDRSNSCCTTWWNDMLTCVPEQSPCPDPSKYIFWDGYHPTEAAFSMLFNQWVKDPSTCFPLSFKQIVES